VVQSLALASSVPNPDGGAPGAILVTTGNDDVSINGNCTLREAVLAANTDTAVDACAAGNGADIIRLPAGEGLLTLSGIEDAGFAGDLDVSTPISVIGAGIDATFVDGGQAERVFEVHSGGRLDLQRLTLRGGQAHNEGTHVRVAAGGRFDGTAIRIEGFRVLAAGSPVPATNTPAGIGNPTLQAVYVLGGATVVLRQCQIESNLSRGAMRTLASSITLIESCTVRGNQRDDEIGGAVHNAGTLTIIGSTFRENTADLGGGAIANTAEGQVTIVNSTFANNSAQASNTRGGGAILNLGRVDIFSSTIAFNSARGGVGAAGVGILTEVQAGSPGIVYLTNTLLAGNSYFLIRESKGGGSVEDCGGNGDVVSLGHSIISQTTACPYTSSGPGDLVNVNPQLGAFGNHGGETATVRLLASSIAIDAGDPLGCSGPQGAPLDFDQRGFLRTGRCDIGAFEAYSPGPNPQLFRDGFEPPATP
jgi:CSLREA domain-containing protein